jgi:DNA-binding HxlR family transcriptional regulator
MSNRHKRRGRGVDATGRSKGKEPFVMLRKFVLASEAYRSLKPLPRAIYTELRRRYNGTNNGYISCSLREIEKELHCSKNTASAALGELVKKGFIKRATCGSFHYKVRHAPTWILTEEEYDGKPATKEFARWSAEEKSAVPEQGQGVPKEGPQ